MNNDSPRLIKIEDRLDALEAHKCVTTIISDRLMDDHASTIQQLESKLKEATAKIERCLTIMRQEGFVFHPKGYMFVPPSQYATFTQEQRDSLHVQGWRS